MSVALDKARAALAAIADHGDGNYDGSKDRHLDLLAIARVQAEIAQAEALERMAAVLEAR